MGLQQKDELVEFRESTWKLETRLDKCFQGKALYHLNDDVGTRHCGQNQRWCIQFQLTTPAIFSEVLFLTRLTAKRDYLQSGGRKICFAFCTHPKTSALKSTTQTPLPLVNPQADQQNIGSSDQQIVGSGSGVIISPLRTKTYEPC